MVKQQRTHMGLIEEIRGLKVVIKQKRVELLKQRIDDLEQSCWPNDLVISGLETKQTLCWAAGQTGDHQGEDVPPKELHTLEQQVVQFLANKNICLKNGQISASHTLARKNNKPKTAIIIKFNKNPKTEVLKQTKKSVKVLGVL